MWYVQPQGLNQSRLGLADDYQDADGRNVLTFAQASRLAVERAVEAKKTDRRVAPRGGHTVGEAVDEYLEKLEAEGKNSIGEIRRVLNKDILPDWRSVAFDDITETRINRWLAKKINEPRRIRGGKALPIDESPEGVRRRRATAQKKWTILRRALNIGRERGWSDGRAWAGIKNLKNIDPPEDEFPTLKECQRLARRAPADFRPIIEATFLCGAAFGELIAMRVRDYTPSSGHVRVFNSKRRPRHIPLTKDGVGLFDELTAGKDADDLIFTHKDRRGWRKSEQGRPMAEANTKAKLEPPITLTRLRKAYGSLLLNAGVDLETVAKAMGHSSSAVTRKHYSRLLQSTVDEQIRKALPSLGIKKRRKVARL
jgi:integrase